MPIYTFYCDNCSKTQEHLVKLADRDLPQPCEDCGSPLKRLIDAPRVTLDPISGDFPGATAAWEKRRAAQLKKENKALADHGSL